MCKLIARVYKYSKNYETKKADIFSLNVICTSLKK